MIIVLGWIFIFGIGHAVVWFDLFVSRQLPDWVLGAIQIQLLVWRRLQHGYYTFGAHFVNGLVGCLRRFTSRVVQFIEIIAWLQLLVIDYSLIMKATLVIHLLLAYYIYCNSIIKALYYHKIKGIICAHMKAFKRIILFDVDGTLTKSRNVRHPGNLENWIFYARVPVTIANCSRHWVRGWQWFA